MAPTTMKTVPSGRVDCCMNGAPAVGGTVGGGYWPRSVGRPLESDPAEDPLPVMRGADWVEPDMVGVPVGVMVALDRGEVEPDSDVLASPELVALSLSLALSLDWVLESDVDAALEPDVVPGRALVAVLDAEFEGALDPGVGCVVPSRDVASPVVAGAFVV